MKYVVLVALSVLVGLQSQSAGQELSQSEQVRIAVQQICPVSGQKLGAHGQPIPVKLGEEEVYLCCQGCTGRNVNTQHWQTIHTNFARSQGSCPVMKEKLPASPKWAIADGRIVYVCCPSCVEKVAEDPKPYIKAVDDLYVAYLRARQNARR
ncbi:MAG: hypothetical protein ACC628_08070 [Pirellulaceae bacterium]